MAYGSRLERLLLFKATNYCCLLKQRCGLASSTHLLATEKQIPKKIEEIVIPKRIKRGPTDILKALSSTVGKDYTAPRYWFIDDPYLIPTSSQQKRACVLAEASGKKTARYMMQKFPQNFVHNPAIPNVPGFNPDLEVDISMAPNTESTLLTCISHRKVKDAINIFKNMSAEGVKISADTSQQFLDLMCVYNCEDPSAILIAEEHYYYRDIVGSSNKNSNRITWKNDNFAECVFESLEEKTPKAYNSLVCGRAKFLQTDKAFEMYHEMIDNKIPVTLRTFNSLLQVAVFSEETYVEKWNKIVQLLKDMEKLGISPTLGTFNAVFFSLSRMTRFRKCKEIAHMILNEMKKFEIEPNLGIWSAVLNIFYPLENSDSLIIYEIIKYLKDKEFTLHYPLDAEFFSNAMAKCFVHIKDPALAYEIDNLLNRGSNYKLLGDAFKEGIYYSFFFRLLCQFETMEKIMEFYDKLTPNVWTPNNMGIRDLLQAIELHDGQEHLPRIWSDLILFEFTKREDILNSIFQLMAKENRSELVERFADIASKIAEQWLEDSVSDMQPLFLLTCTILGDFIVISLKAKRFDQAWKLFEIYNKNPQALTGCFSESSLLMLLMSCIEKKKADKALQCLMVMNTMGHVINKEVQENMNKELELSASQKYYLESLNI